MRRARVGLIRQVDGNRQLGQCGYGQVDRIAYGAKARRCRAEGVGKLQAQLRATCTVLLLSTAAQGQPAADTPVGIVDDPCPPAVAMPDGVRALLDELFMETRSLGPDDIQRLVRHPDFAAYNAAGRGLGAQDWPNLCRFSAANAELLASGQRPDVVFMGDSITENWLLGDPALFGTTRVNRGIGGQTTPQMLLRFRADLGNDGVHPNRAGYAVMRRVLRTLLPGLAP